MILGKINKKYLFLNFNCGFQSLELLWRTIAHKFPANSNVHRVIFNHQSYSLSKGMAGINLLVPPLNAMFTVHYKLEFVSYDLKCFTNRSIIKCIFIMQSLFYFHSVGKRLEALQELSSLAQQSTEDNFAIAADDFCSKYS